MKRIIRNKTCKINNTSAVKCDITNGITKMSTTVKATR